MIESGIVYSFIATSFPFLADVWWLTVASLGFVRLFSVWKEKKKEKNLHVSYPNWGSFFFFFFLHLLNTPWHTPPHPWRPQTWGNDTCQRFWPDKSTAGTDKNTGYDSFCRTGVQFCLQQKANILETVLVNKKTKQEKKRKEKTRTDTTSNHQRKWIFSWFCLDKVDTPSKPTNDLSQHPEASNIQMLPPCCWGRFQFVLLKQKQQQKKSKKKWLTNKHAHTETSDALHSQTQPWGTAALVGRWRGCAGCHCCHGSSTESDSHVSERETFQRRLEKHLGRSNSLWAKCIFTIAEHPGAALMSKKTKKCTQ